MTYSSDPTRWSASGNDAPELLRDAFSAGRHEGPNNLQMRALALKLAAVGTGAALAAGAGTAQASTTAAGGTAAGSALAAAKTGGALTLSKIAVSLALVGAAATGAVMLRNNAAEPVRSPGYQAQVEATLASDKLAPGMAQAADPMRASLGAPVEPTQNAAPQAVIAQAVVAPAVINDAPAAPELAAAETEHAAQDVVVADPSAAKAHRAAHAERHGNRATSAQTATSNVAPTSAAETKAASSAVSAQRVVGGRQQLSEIELLRGARSALAAHPREAYRLTEQHKALYPQGVFAQERDALAVEAAQRAGDLKLARRLAESFVKSFPSSPHAHRFRETMNLQ